MKFIVFNKKLVKLSMILFLHILISCFTLSAQYKYKIIVDINQIWRNELPDAGKLKCDGVWAIPGNSAGNKGRDIPVEEWLVGYNALGPGFLVTEDYWRNFPAKNYDLTEMAVGQGVIKMACGYAEPNNANDDHETTVINNDVIDDIHDYANAPVIVLARAYMSGKWKNHVTRALSNDQVGGVCFEQKPDITKYKNYEILDGLKATLDSGRKAFMLLPPNFASDSKNYTADLVKLFEYIQQNKPEILDNENLYFVPNCYNRQKDKTTTMYGDDDSVEGAIKKLKELRNSKPSAVVESKKSGAIIYPSITNNILHVENHTNNPAQLSIVHIGGSIVKQATLHNQKATVKLGGLPSGMYLAVLQGNAFQYNQRIIIR